MRWKALYGWILLWHSKLWEAGLCLGQQYELEIALRVHDGRTSMNRMTSPS